MNIKQMLENELDVVFQDKSYKNQVLNWHENQHFIFENEVLYTIEELKFHHQLYENIKADILTDVEYLKTYYIRKNGLSILPDWINPITKKIDESVMEELWLQANKGYLVRILEASEEQEDKEALEKILKSSSFEYRGTHLSQEERKALRLEKLQQSINDNKIVIFLGRQNRVYKNLQNKLNQKYNEKYQFVSDHSWSSCGYVERGMKASNNRVSLIQASETIKRLPYLGLVGENIAERFIMFSLDSYDAKVCLSAMYSNPNKIARTCEKPVIEGIEKFVFAYTGLTDLELANIVRNKEWFALTRFCRTNQENDVEELSSEQVLQEYGIAYIGEKI